MIKFTPSTYLPNLSAVCEGALNSTLLGNGQHIDFINRQIPLVAKISHGLAVPSLENIKT
jgi:hypothetical protein